VVTIHENLGLNNGDKARLLDGTSIASKAPSIFLNREVGGAAIRGDLENSSPLGEAGTLGIVSGGSLLEAVKSSAPCLDLISSGKGLETSVDLDTRENTILLEELDKGGSVLVALEEGFLVEDGTGDVIAEVGGSEEKA